MIDGKVFVVSLAILEQYSLHKIWIDIMNVFEGYPIRNKNGIKVQVMFPCQIKQQIILTDKNLLEAFKHLKVNMYS